MNSGIGSRRSAARDHASVAYELRRTEIVAAAGALFRKRGYQGTTLAGIADAVGTERASLYYYFAGKEDMFDSLVTERVLQNLAMAERIRDSDDQPSEKLRSLVVHLMESFAEHYPFLYVYLQQNMAHVAPKRKAWAGYMRDVNRRFENTVIDIVEQGVADGSFRIRGEPRITAYGILGMVSWTHRWFNPGSTSITAREIADSYARVLISGIAVMPPNEKELNYGAGI